MAAEHERDYRFYSRLRQLLRRPTVKSRTYADRPSNRLESRVFGAFAKIASNQYMHSLAGSTERLARTRDYELMDISSSIISTALNIWADDCTTYSEDGKVLKITSNDAKIKQHLNNLFSDRLNVDYNLWHWLRNTCKYGDFFLMMDVIEGEGVTTWMALPTVEIEREEAYDGDINSVRFKWNTASSVTFENWQIAHFRMIGDDTFLPYGKSLLESGRRIWKQLNLIEDAMLVYRIQRAPERRIFKIDVGNIQPNDIPAFMQKAKDILKRSPLVQEDGRIDLRFNVHSQEEDYFLAVRGRESGTDISTLPGAQNLGDIDDVRYVQNNLIAALGIPRAYLTFEEQLNSKTTLSQEDVRFARTIQRIQKLCISELNKIAMIHLYALGYTDPDDLTNFQIHLTNPSTVGEQMKLELESTRLTAYMSAVQSVGVDREWAQKHILRLSDTEIKRINVGVMRDSKFNAEVQVVAQKVAEENAPAQPGGGGEAGGGGKPGGGKPAAGGGGEPLPAGQQPTDALPGGQAVPAAPPTGGQQQGIFKNSPDNPMTMTNPKKKDVKKEEQDRPEGITDLFDPADKDDLELIKVAKKYDFLSKALGERSKVSSEVSNIFINIDKKFNSEKKE